MIKKWPMPLVVYFYTLDPKVKQWWEVRGWVAKPAEAGSGWSMRWNVGEKGWPHEPEV